MSWNGRSFFWDEETFHSGRFRNERRRRRSDCSVKIDIVKTPQKYQKTTCSQIEIIYKTRNQYTKNMNQNNKIEIEQ